MARKKSEEEVIKEASDVVKKLPASYPGEVFHVPVSGINLDLVGEDSALANFPIYTVEFRKVRYSTGSKWEFVCMK